MCSHYQAVKKAEQMEKFFRARGLPPPKADMRPKYQGVFVRRPPEWDSGDEAVPEREAVIGRWGLVSGMTKADGLAKAEKLSTFNARSESAATSFTFGNARRRGQYCIIPAEAIYEPDHREETKLRMGSKGPVSTRFTRADGAPLGVAGLWDRYRNAAGELVDSFTMLTINADNHPLFKHYHAPGKEKRMVVILPFGAFDAWLTAKPSEAGDFMAPYPADKLVAEPVAKGEPPV